MAKAEVEVEVADEADLAADEDKAEHDSNPPVAAVVFVALFHIVRNNHITCMNMNTHVLAVRLDSPPPRPPARAAAIMIAAPITVVMKKTLRLTPQIVRFSELSCLT